MLRNALLNPSIRQGFILPAVILVLTFASAFLLVTQTQAANGINKTINFQGKVVNADGTNVANGVYNFVVQIYDGAGNAASSLYSESWSSGSLFSSTMSSAPTTSSDTLTYSSNTNESSLKVGQILWNTTKGEAIIITSVNTGTNVLGISRPIVNWANGDTITNGIYVKDGVFRIAINSLNQNITGVNFGSDSLFVGVNFNGDGEMRPRMQLRANAYAYNAEKVNGLTVTNTSDTAFSTTTTLKINDGSTVSFGGNFNSGSNALTLTTSGSTTLTLPTTGTVSTIAGTETLTNKTIGSTGLTFSGATTDITTATNEGLTLEANGTGDITLVTDAGSDLIISGMTTDANGVLYANTTGVLTRVVETETGNLCLLSGAGASGAPTWGSCTGSSSLQVAYAGGNTIETAVNTAVVVTETTTGAASGDLLQLTVNQAAAGSFSGDALQIVMDGTTADAFTGNGIRIEVDASQSTGNLILAEDDGGVDLFSVNEAGLTMMAGGFDSNAASTVTSLTIDGTTGLDISNTGVTNDIQLQNDETIDNNTNGSFNFGRNDAGTVTITAKDTDAVAALDVVSGGAAALRLDTGGAAAINIGNTNATSLAIGRAGATAMTFVTDNNANNDFTFTGGTTFNDDVVITAGASEVFQVSRTFTNNTSENGMLLTLTTSDTGSATTAQYGLLIDNAASTEGADALIALQNTDADDVVTTGIRFTAGGAGTDFTTGIDFDLADVGTEIILENGESISNQSDGVINFGSTTSLTASGALTILPGGATAMIIGGGSMTGLTISTNGTGDGVLTLPGQSVSAAEILNNTLDFSKFADAMTLDATSSIAFGASTFGLTFTNNGSGDEVHNQSSTGNFIIQDSGAAIATYSGAGAITFAPTSGQNFGITTAGAGNMSVTSGITTQATTGSAFALNANSLTSGTGFYATSSTLTSGKLVDIQVSGTAAAASQTGLNILMSGATATNAITTYGAQISNTHTNATSGTNVGLLVSATGATTANYALVTNGGNVGIGTTTPGVLLDVSGAIRGSSSLTLSSMTTDANSVLYANTSGVLTRVTETETGSQCLLSGAGVSGVPTWGACGTGGIAWSSLSSPSTSLTLNHATNTSVFNWDTGTSTNNLFTLETDASSNGTGALLRVATGTSSTVLPLRVTAGGNDALMVDASGNVGIGNNNPTRPLHVYGMAPNSSNGATAYINSELTSTTNNQMGLFADSNIILSSASNRTYMGLQGSIYNGQAGTNLQNASMIGLRGSAYFDGTGTYGEVKGGDYAVTLDAAGIINSAYGLMINGAINNGGTINSLYGLVIGGQTTGVDSVGLAINEATGSDDDVNLLIGTTTAPNADYSIYNSSVKDNYFAGNVGIGTTTPTFKLELAGSIGPSSNDAYDLGSDSRRFRDIYLGPDTLHIGTSTSDEYTVGYDTTNNRLGFNVNGSGDPEVVFDSSGNVGIGNTNPQTKLTVSGNAQISYGGTTSGSLYVGATANPFLGVLRVESDTITTSSLGRFISNSTSTSSRNLVDIINDNTAATGTTALRIQQDSTGDIVNFFDGSTEVFTVLDGGNVGIGNTAPSEKLDVAGNIELTGSIKAAAAPTTTSTTQTSTGIDTSVDASFNSTAIGLDGLPVIAYYNLTTSDLKVVKCGNAACSSGNTITAIDSTGVVGTDNSIAVPADGFPIISYYDTTNTNLKVVKCGNAACSSGNTITTVDSTANATGVNSSIAIGQDGLAVISYWHGSASFDLRVLKCGNATCSSGNTTTTVDTTGDVGLYSSIAIGLDGNPVISYYDNTNDNLKVMKCGNAACSSGNVATTVDSANDVGNYTSIAVPADGLPIISFDDYSPNFDLRITKCGNSSCTSGNTTTTIDSTGSVGTFTSIAVGTDGLPVISYIDETRQYLKVLKCGNATCASGNTITTLDTSVSVGNFTSIVVGADNLPFLTYHDTSNTNLRVTKCANASCSKTGVTTYSGGSDLGSSSEFFNNVYAANIWGKEMSVEGNIELSGVIKGSDIGARAFNNAAQSIGIATNTALNLNSELYDTDNMHSTTALTSRMTINTPGKYVLTGNVQWASTVTSGYMFFQINGSAIPALHQVIGNYGTMQASTVYTFDVGDYVELYVNQSSGSSVNTIANGYSPAFSIQRIAGADLAEYYAMSDTSIREGDIVSIDSDIPGAAKKSISPYEKTLGIISSNPAVIMGNTADKENNKLVGLKGKVPVKVSTRNGLIKNGDGIAASTLPGFGVRAGQAGNLAAVALDDFDPAKMQCQDAESLDTIPWPKEGENLVVTGHGLCYKLPNGEYVGQILASIDNSFYEPYTITDAGNIKITNLAEKNASYEMSLGNDWGSTAESRVSTIKTDTFDVKVGNEVVTRQGLFSDLVAGKIKVGEIDASRIKVKGIDLMDLLGMRGSDSASLRTVGSLIAQNGQELSASFSGKPASFTSLTAEGLTVGGLKVSGSADIADLKVGTLTLHLGMSGGKLSVKGVSDEEVLSIDQFGNASMSGVLTVDTLRAKQIEGLEFIESRFTSQDAKITLLESLLASRSAQVAVLGVTADGKIAGTSGTITPQPQPKVDGESAHDILAENLTKLLEVSDSANATDFDIRTLSVDGLSADAATVSADLRVRGNGMIEGVLNVIDTLTAGNIIVNGISHFLGEVIFKDAVTFEKAPTFSEDTAGYVVVSRGAKTVTVSFENEYADQPVIAAELVSSLLSDEDYDKLLAAEYCTKDSGKEVCQEKLDLKLLSEKPDYIVTNRTKKGFTILLPKDAEIDYTFSWTAFSVRKVSSSDSSIDKRVEELMKNLQGT